MSLSILSIMNKEITFVIPIYVYITCSSALLATLCTFLSHTKSKTHNNGVVLHNSGTRGSGVGMEAAELAVAEAKEAGEAAESTGLSRQSVQAFGWGLSGYIDGCQVSTTHGSLK